MPSGPPQPSCHAKTLGCGIDPCRTCNHPEHRSCKPSAMGGSPQLQTLALGVFVEGPVSAVVAGAQASKGCQVGARLRALVGLMALIHRASHVMIQEHRRDLVTD